MYGCYAVRSPVLLFFRYTPNRRVACCAIESALLHFIAPYFDDVLMYTKQAQEKLNNCPGKEVNYDDAKYAFKN